MNSFVMKEIQDMRPSRNRKQRLTAGRLWLAAAFLIAHFSLLFTLTACSEEEAEAGEWDNWEQRNDAFFASLADSLRANPSQWVHVKNFSLDPDQDGQPTDYVYAKVVEPGDGAGSPAYTDSVRVIYQGRLIPSATYPQGYVFDAGSVYGDFSPKTSATRKMLVSAMTDGFATALQRMHRGERWRLYVPSDLAYGDDGLKESGAVVIPGHSVLIFDLMLIDFSAAGETMLPWSSRQKN